MKCADLELVLCDYLDGALRDEHRSAVERHLEECADCASLARDARGVALFLERVPDVDVPPALITRIIQETPVRQRAAAKARGVLGGLFGRWFQPVLQPRVVMGMAMTILFFSMLGRFAGIEARQLKPADLDPVKIYQAADDKVHRAWVMAVKYYESLRFVYEIQSRVRELTEPEEGSAGGGEQSRPAARPSASQGGDAATGSAGNPGNEKR